MADPLILDPNYYMQAMSMAALRKLTDNPATDPDTTPPAVVGTRGQHMVFIPTGVPAGMPTGGAPDALATPPSAEPPPVPQVTPVELGALTADDKKALETLQRDGIIEQVDENSWRFKQL